MIRSEKVLSFLFLFAVVLSNIIHIAEATSINFTVRGGEEVTKSLTLAVEDHVFIKFSVVGQPDNTLGFYITFPNGTVREFGKLGGTTYRFVCDSGGEYILHFSNTDSLEDKLVTLDYEVEHYIFGIPQTLFLTIIIAGVCVAAVAAFILMGKRR